MDETQRDDVIELMREIADLKAKVEQLQAIVAMLPQTADGVSVVPGMTVWELDPWGTYRSLNVRVDCYSDPTKCYSTREAAEAGGGE